MVWIESVLRRLKNSVNRLVVPSAALPDVRALEAQIELRRQALRDIEVIRCRLRPFMRRESRSLHRRLRTRRVNGSCLVGPFRGRRPS
jgi:hypothetical protein